PSRGGRARPACGPPPRSRPRAPRARRFRSPLRPFLSSLAGRHAGPVKGNLTRLIDPSINPQSTALERVIGTPPMSGSKGYERPGIGGSGAIATGLAAVSTTTAETILLARSEASAWRAEEKVVAACAKIEGGEPSRLRVTTDPKDLADCDVVVEAVVEEVGPKGELLAAVAEAVPDADLATTTSSLGIGDIAG